MTVVHTVLFKIAADADSSVVSEIISSLLSLEKACVKPHTNQPYMKSLQAGKNTEGDRFTHVAVLEFENAEDLAYYMHTDPVHQAVHAKLMSMIGTVVLDALAVDFTPGAF